ncbi:MAG: UvrD-helicase domain-containing protein [Clostridia bacterium]|nr:UvrD-helicase domain-containing protein [Clostridia bacterium]
MIIELNEEQKQAMLATEGAVLVTAGAGSGKTRLLTQRIAYLIQEKGVEPFNILAITFTNKASKEMKDRVEQIIGGQALVWISTIHSMCATILRRDIEKLNPKYNSYFTIYGTDDTNKMLKKAMNIDDKKNENKDKDNDKDENFLKQVSYHMSVIKNANIPYEVYINQNSHIKDIEDIVDVIKRYQILLEESNALDFDDLLTFTENLLKKDENVRNYYNNRFKYILVDEFQDTNVVQYNIIKLLAGNNKNIFVVGDEDQCIYGWRGANIKNIKNFIKDYENCQIFKLEQNYRSTKNILEIANKLISFNSERIPKELKSNKETNGSIIYRSFSTDKQEAEYVAQTIYSLHEKGIDYSEMAILMRLNALSRNFEEKLLSYNIPHAVYGGFKFFDRLEVKNAVAYLRLIANPNDISSFIRIVNYPKRGIGEVTIDKIVEASQTYNLSIYDICGNIDLVASINSGTKEKIKAFYLVLEDIKQVIKEKGISEGIAYLIKRAGFKELYSDRSEENKNRLMNLDSLVQSAQEFEENATNVNLINYLENITLVSDSDIDNGQSSAVTIATVHGVKGLEYKVVFIVGAEQKIFPIVRDDRVDEEERRLMYVAITRAKEQLYLTNSQTRFLYGHYEYMVPSTFLKEMGFVAENSYNALNESPKTATYGVKNIFGDNFTDYRNDKPDFVKFGGGKSLNELNRTKQYFADKKPTKTGFEVGRKVNHSHYGIGVITDVSGEGISKMVTVQFEVVGKKNLLLDYAPLTLVD